MDQVTFFDAEYHTKKRKTRCWFATLYADLLRLAGAYFRHSNSPPLQKHKREQGRCCLCFARSYHFCINLVQKNGGLTLDVRVRKSPSKEVLQCFFIYFNANQVYLSTFKLSDRFGMNSDHVFFIQFLYTHQNLNS
jgi:hypothetical protein